MASWLKSWETRKLFVAAANGANPISIFVPCHRVIGGNHKLVGYGGGLEAKKGLLDLEMGVQSLLNGMR